MQNCSCEKIRAHSLSYLHFTLFCKSVINKAAMAAKQKFCFDGGAIFKFELCAMRDSLRGMPHPVCKSTLCPHPRSLKWHSGALAYTHKLQPTFVINRTQVPISSLQSEYVWLVARTSQRAQNVTWTKTRQRLQSEALQWTGGSCLFFASRPFSPLSPTFPYRMRRHARQIEISHQLMRATLFAPPKSGRRLH